MLFKDWGFGLDSSLFRYKFQLAKAFEFPCMVLNFLISRLRSCI